MRKHIVGNIIPALLATIFVVMIIPAMESVERTWKRTINAIDWIGVTVKTPVVNPGGTLDIVYPAIINKQCPSDIRGFIIASDGTVPVRFPTVAGGYTKPTGEAVNIPVSIKIPLKSDLGLEELESGKYIYRSIVTRYCFDGVEEDNKVPDAAFNLEVPSR